MTGPLLKWFGSKWLSAKRLPPPEYPTLIEPFAGGAGYACRFPERNVVLAESDPHLYALWRWLISEATEGDIREIPLNLPEGTDIRSVGLSYGQSLLLKTWQRTNNVGSCWTISPWGNKPGQWTANTRARVAAEVGEVKHWEIHPDGLDLLRREREATWFVDPPYQYNYQYRQPSPVYDVLARLIQGQKGQIIVCEAACPKTGSVPQWLPFLPFAERVTSRRKLGCHTHSRELLAVLSKGWLDKWSGRDEDDP